MSINLNKLVSFGIALHTKRTNLGLLRPALRFSEAPLPPVPNAAARPAPKGRPFAIAVVARHAPGLVCIQISGFAGGGASDHLPAQQAASFLYGTTCKLHRTEWQP